MQPSLNIIYGQSLPLLPCATNNQPDTHAHTTHSENVSLVKIHMSKACQRALHPGKMFIHGARIAYFNEHAVLALAALIAPSSSGAAGFECSMWISHR